MRHILFLLFVGMSSLAFAQQYTGMSGLIHVPTADMNDMGEARIGGHFLNKEFVPNEAFAFRGSKYHTNTHYLSITPFSWIELAYTCTLMKGYKNNEDLDDYGYYHKDRYFSIKVQPIREHEGKWWPSIAIGSNDPVTTSNKKDRTDLPEKNRNQIFANFYIAATKHFSLQNQVVGIHLAYRKWKRNYNSKWNGPVGGITFQPSFQKNLRLIAEYTGNEVNVGFDWKLWKHLLLQSSLQDGRYFTGGICFCMNLL
ncbi:putative uncharacterized protein [Bacteroides intestinalis CAG:315]|jgi:hypothetical protein|uniref:YjbH domain-containing protein n=1 Tax=Bacteroides intestinalis TaxID=329854 RepID=A0A412YDW1_9BACE|nr:YjbH domain-containing protein [Bacteroides intestinalis]RGV55595.1 hypothetical protein DWW10_07310 [Bacteroides intestinalis]RHA60625.1 hypothetical protein DW932_11080 [Bacteroides intestinalis]CDD94143.1 putative uncharacterized protein [Bacteroides intestinalis CAG:315]